jgi:peptidoglycan/LPS O-acetylase OafA/YrhL
MVLLLAWYGYFDATRKFSEDASFFPAIREYHQPKFETFKEQLYDWFERTFRFVHVWDFDPFGGSTGYDLHLWTIPLEFRASMVLFLLQMGLSRAKTWVRWTCLYGFAWFCHRHGRWDILLFVFGLFFAEVDVIRAARRKLNSPSASPLPTSAATFEKPTRLASCGRVWKQYFWLFVGGCGLFLMSSPDDQASVTPGYMYLSTLIPDQFTSHKYRYWQGIGSILFVLATNFSPILQRPFNSAVVQYFGKISYAIYLVHGPVLHTAGYTIMRWAWGVTGNETEGQHVAGFALATIFIVPVVVWAADIFWRFIDAPTVKFAKWVEEKCDAGNGNKR